MEFQGSGFQYLKGMATSSREERVARGYRHMHMQGRRHTSYNTKILKLELGECRLTVYTGNWALFLDSMHLFEIRQRER